MRSKNSKTIIVTFILVAAMLAAPWAALADTTFDDPQVKAAEMAADTLIARPLGIVATILGFGLFIVSAPFSAMGDNTDETWDTLVAEPARFSFKRPLGDFE